MTRPEPPDHPGCAPEALTLDADYGWTCQECAAILGGVSAADWADADVQGVQGGGPHAAVVPIRGLPPGQARADSSLSPIERIGQRMRTLDPTQVHSPQDAAEQLHYMMDRLADAELAQRDITHERTDAEIAYRRAYDLAVARRKGQGAADVRAAEARIECADELDRLDRAKGVLEAIKGAAHSWRSMISGYQTSAGLIRDTYNVGGRYGGT